MQTTWYSQDPNIQDLIKVTNENLKGTNLRIEGRQYIQTYKVDILNTKK